MRIMRFYRFKKLALFNEALLAHPWLEPKAESQGLFRAKSEKSNAIRTEQQKHTTVILWGCTFKTLDKQCQVTKAEMRHNPRLLPDLL